MSLAHIILALAVQSLVGISTGDWWVGAALAIGIFVGREHAQAEYRWIEAFGQQRRAQMPWWGGFDPRVWHKVDAWLDFLLPFLAVILAAIAVGGSL